MGFSRYNLQHGFALPITLMLGMIFMVIGASILVRSQSDNATATAQRSNLRGLNAAEIGIGRVQSLMNQHRGMATYSAFDPGTSWSNASGIPNLSSRCSGNPVAEVEAIATKATNWIAIDPNDDTKGRYRLVNYTYDTTQKNGTLVIEGSTGTENTAVTRLAVKIPILATTESLPGIWVKDSFDPGGGIINGTIWGPCSGPFGTPGGGSYKAKRTAFRMPTPPSPPNIPPLNPVPNTLPQPTDSPDANGVHQYVVSNLSDSLTFTPGKKVHLWVQGNIDLQNGESLKHPCSTTTAPCSPFDVQIYGSAPTGTLNLSGNASICDILVWAPTYRSTLSGAPAQICDGGVHNNAIYWVQNWTTSSPGTPVTFDQTLTSWTDSPIPPLDQIGPIADWRREQTN